MMWLIDAATIGTALVAGIFFAFSTFVMRALGRLDPKMGIAAMQSINVVVINPLFLLAFFGAGLLSLAAIGTALLGGSGAARTPVFVGAFLYLAGCLLVTIAGNVPLNERLAKVDPSDPRTADLWSLYLRRWTWWNHVRTAASLGAAAAFALAA